MKLRWLFSLFLFASTSLLAEDATLGEKLCALRVKPLFSEKCSACHADNPDNLEGDFDLRSRASILKGGEAFGHDVLISGKGNESFLYRVVAYLEEGYEMPPKLADRLTEQQTWWIRDWIDAGAPWPDDERVARIQQQYAEGEQVETSKALSDDWQNRRYESTKLWAYRPLKVVQVPNDQHPVDWFLGRKLKSSGVIPAGDANATELVRRMSFGLTGLPPKAEQIDEFQAAYAENVQAAVEEFGNELLASPHYGEHFGQHWLDVTRYADTAGYANDYSRPHAWRYRDYVVRAFNDDKPFDQFAREQIAGDEIAGHELPGNPVATAKSELLIATGFLRMGPWEQTGMSVFKETRQLWLDDVTDSVGQTFLGHAMQCAKCHDHKFDPVPTRDYYAMMAVFSTTQFADRDAPFIDFEPKKGFEQANQQTQKKIAYYASDLKAITEKIAQQKKNETTDAKVGDNGLDPGDEASKARISKNKLRHGIELDRTRPFAHAVYTGKNDQESKRSRQNRHA